jgi:hypothetical protein
LNSESLSVHLSNKIGMVEFIPCKSFLLRKKKGMHLCYSRNKKDASSVCLSKPNC